MLLTLVVCCFTCLMHLANAYKKQVSLTPNVASIDNNTAVYTSNDVIINDNKWLLTMNDNIGYSMKINLAQTLGIHSTLSSTLTMTMYGASNIGDLLIAFADQSKYIAINLPFNSNNDENMIVPSCGSDTSYNGYQYGSIETFMDATNMADATPFCKLAANDPFDTKCAATQQMKPVWNGNYRNIWPLTFILSFKEPWKLQIIYETSDDRANQSCWFVQGRFLPDQGLNIFISGGNVGDSFIISQIDIQYEYNDGVSHPTSSKTSKPTMNPSATPNSTKGSTMTPFTEPTVSNITTSNNMNAGGDHNIHNSSSETLYILIIGGSSLLIIIPLCFGCGYFYNKKRSGKQKKVTSPKHRIEMNQMMDQQYVHDMRAISLAKHRKLNSKSLIKLQQIEPRTPKSYDIDDLHIPSFIHGSPDGPHITMPDGVPIQPPLVSKEDMITPGYVENVNINNDNDVKEESDLSSNHSRSQSSVIQQQNTEGYIS